MNGSCNDSFQTIVNTCMMGCYVLSIIAFVMTSIVHYMNRHAYHPIFSFLFFMLTFVYVFSNTLNVTEFAIISFGSTDGSVAYDIVGRVHQGLYIYLTCVVAMCVVERCFATIRMHTYEHWRPWGIIVAAQFFAAVAIYVHLRVVKNESVQLALSIVIILFLIFLLYKNVRLTQLFRGGKSSLSTRYQLTENIKILRLLVPVVVLDTTLCVTDMVGEIFFHIEPYFDQHSCLLSPSYLPAYFIFRLVSIVMEWSIPISIIYQQATPEPFKRCLQRMQLFHYKKTHPKKITNVLGTDIQGTNHQLDYFMQLQQQWSGPLPPKR